MIFTLQDVFGLLLAMVLAVPVLVLPGAVAAHATDLLGFKALDRSRRLMVAALAGFATIPALASLSARVIGLDLTLVLIAPLAIGGWMLAGPSLRPDWSRATWLAVAAALAALAVVTVDLAGGGRLYPSLLMMDLVKHAAFTSAIAETGSTPPVDPFFLRPGAASYYYFFYTPAALIRQLGAGIIDSRMAFIGLIPWVALATVGLADLVYEKAGLARGPGERRVPLLLVLMSTAGLQLVFVVMFWLKGETWREQSGWLNEMVASFLTTVLWVPHHLAALLAAWVGFLLLVDATAKNQPPSRENILRIAVAAIAFAGSVGLSVWVALGAAVTMVVWGALAAYERRWARLATMATAGLLALVLVAPHLADIQHNRDFSEFPIAVRIRFFAVADALSDALGGGQSALRFLLLPLNYFWESALLVLGATAFWTRHRRRDVHRNETARLLTISAATSLLIGSFFAAAIANNDLGWRVVLFAQLSATLWTVNVLWPLWRRASRQTGAVVRLAFVPRPFVAVTALGLLAGAHDVAMLRAHVFVNQHHPSAHPLDTATLYDERIAYDWLARHRKPYTVVQHNPDTTRAYGFGLYGRQRTAISDRHQATLFGAAPAAVRQRLQSVVPSFAAALPATAVQRELAAAGVEMVMITRRDPAWQQRAAWVFASPALLVRDNLRLLAIEDLTDVARAGK